MNEAGTTTIDEAGSTRGRVARARFASIAQKHGALIVLVLVCIFAFARYETFLTQENLMNILRQNSMVGLIALGMTFVILTGGIDLSVGSLYAVASVVAVYLAGYGLLAALAGAVAATAVLGFINGVVIAKARIQPFIVTLAMMIAARGLALAVTDEKSVSAGRDAPATFGWLARGYVGPVPVPVLLLFVVFILGWVVLNHTRFGRHVYSVGDNEEAARLMGLNVGRVTILVYALSGALAGLAGVIFASRLGTGQPTAGIGWELDAIAAVVVGGTLLTGGQGGVGSTLVGVLLLGVILNILTKENISSWWQLVLRGIILLAVVIVQNRLSKKNN